MANHESLLGGLEGSNPRIAVFQRRHAYVTSTVTFSKMEGDNSDMNLTFVLQDDETEGPC